jgi:competence protein ComEC
VQCALAERERWVLWLPVAFGTGIAVYFALPSEPASLLGLALGSSGLLLAIASLGAQASGSRAALSCIAAVLIGFGIAKHRTDSVAAPVLSHRVGPSLLRGRVETVELHGKGVRVVLTLADMQDLHTNDMPKRVRISVRSGGDALKPGEWIGVRAVLLPPPAPAEPGDYDFGRAAYFRGIGGVGYAYGRPKWITAARAPSIAERVHIEIESLRVRVSARIHSVLPGSTGAIASALITGDRGGISEDDESALRDAGLAHVLAIAGLHMALVGLGLFWAVRALLALFPAIALTQPIKKWAAAAALGSATFYLIISGAATPATRAYIMLTVMLVAILFDRPAISCARLGWPLSSFCCCGPKAFWSPGSRCCLRPWWAWSLLRNGSAPASVPKTRCRCRGCDATCAESPPRVSSAASPLRLTPPSISIALRITRCSAICSLCRSWRSSPCPRRHWRFFSCPSDSMNIRCG